MNDAALAEKYDYGPVGLHLGEWYYFNLRYFSEKNWIPDCKKRIMEYIKADF